MATIFYKSLDGITSTEIDPFSFNMQNGESSVWKIEEQGGFLFKHLARVWIITNFRIMVYSVEHSKMEGLLLLSNLSDVQVVNRHRLFNSSSASGYSSLGRGIGTGLSYSRGTSNSVGDLLFLSEGRVILTWRNMNDAQGIKNLTLSLKRQFYPQKEIEKYLNGVSNKNALPNYYSNVCNNCGSKNMAKSDFCRKCGRSMP